MKLIDELGNRYNKLVVIERAAGPTTSAYWLCRCDCGGAKVVAGKMLRNGNTGSCGCLEGRNGGRKKQKVYK